MKQRPISIILHSTTVLYCLSPTDLTRREGRRAFGIHVLTCVCFSLLNCKLLEDQNQDFITLSPQSLKHFMKGNTCCMNGHLQRLRIKYLTFSSNPGFIVGLSGSQNVDQMNLPSSIFPAANSMGWGSPRLSLDCLRILGFRDSLVLSTSPSASPPLGQPAVPAMHYESHPSSITCQLCDLRQVMFGIRLSFFFYKWRLWFRWGWQTQMPSGSGKYWEWGMWIFSGR